MLVTLLRSLPILRTADHQLIEPAGKRRLESKLTQTPCQLDAGLLRDVFGVRAVTTPFPGNAIDGGVVQIQQLGERGDVAALCAPNKTR